MVCNFDKINVDVTGIFNVFLHRLTCQILALPKTGKYDGIRALKDRIRRLINKTTVMDYYVLVLDRYCVGKMY